jgi:hypothetical protein
MLSVGSAHEGLLGRKPVTVPSALIAATLFVARNRNGHEALSRGIDSALLGAHDKVVVASGATGKHSGPKAIRGWLGRHSLQNEPKYLSKGNSSAGLRAD